MRNYLSSAFSLNMVSGDTVLRVSESSPDRVPEGAISCIGHESTAKVVSKMLDREVIAQRVAVSLEVGDAIYVVTLFNIDGSPYRAQEGVILGQDELQGLRLAIRRVVVIRPPSPLTIESTLERLIQEATGEQTSVALLGDEVSVNVSGRCFNDTFQMPPATTRL